MLDGLPDLSPQNKYENLTLTLAELGNKIKEKTTVTFDDFDEQPWLDFVHLNLQKLKHVYGPENLNENEIHTNDFTWTQNDKTIMITLITRQDRITIDNEKIDSPVLKGLWWGPVNNIEMISIGEEDNEMVQITFETEFRWPTLIKGGNPDAISAHYIALCALELENQLFFTNYLAYSAMHNCATSIRALSLLLLDDGRYEESAYWSLQSIVQFGDLLCGHIVAKQLINGMGVEKDARLAEYILCRLVKEGFPDAFFSLGRLYLEGDDGVEKAEEKAKFLLLLAAYQFGDERALKAVEALGIGPSAAEGSTPVQPIEPEAEAKGAERELTRNTSTVDWAIAGAVVASVGAAGFYALNKLFRHIRK
ncbi:hypothetical protein TRFO_14366 [Tritrichomonas foetus]|uniref:Uncharacterized protein n=1 Tax=Tritrichomonas foetus TaxID=1144522 RepID=A0A1J4KZQ0_9EUKA|nr:hypothetical protein TRFO_14366 [Tritrichomonas foetus]|eukprot:OHT15182.1 hypothetical protein TRFO_14366 [Tritrichomonas foetus]